MPSNLEQVKVAYVQLFGGDSHLSVLSAAVCVVDCQVATLRLKEMSVSRCKSSLSLSLFLGVNCAIIFCSVPQ